MPGSASGDDESWAWLDDPPSAHPEFVDDHAPAAGTDSEPEPVEPEENWVRSLPVEPPARSSAPRARPWRRMPARGWAALAAATAVAVGALAAAHGGRDRATDIGSGAVATSVSAAAGACAGLSGTVVTDRGGDRATVPGVIAMFEDAYYRQRSAEAAMQMLAPEAGITQESLAAGIATIPVGTTYCVAITPVTANTARVHIAELHPDANRVDYLQVINTISGPTGTPLISHIQEQG